MEESLQLRLSKYISHSGITSRRTAGEWVKKGLIQVNHVVEKNPAYIVQSADIVTYQGKIIKPQKHFVYYLLNKAKKTISSRESKDGKRTVIDSLGNKVKETVFPVNKLDYNTTGLLVLTDDQSFIKKLNDKQSDVLCLWKIFISEPISVERISKLKQGIRINDFLYQAESVKCIENKECKELLVQIKCSDDEIIKQLFLELDLMPDKMDRLVYGGLTKKDLPRGWFRRLTEKEVVFLKHF